jgi:hypothetical protein
VRLPRRAPRDGLGDVDRRFRCVFRGPSPRAFAATKSSFVI